MAKCAKLKKIANVLLNVILVLSIVMIAFTILVRVAGNNPSIGGFMLYRISSGSMEPELNVGDVIISQKVSDITSIDMGDVITYRGTEGSYAGKMITHKVVIPPYKQGDKYYLLTMGVANDNADPVITEDQVESKMIAKLPLFGAIYNFFITPWGLVASILLIIIAFAAEFRRIRKMPILDELSDEEKANSTDTSDSSDNLSGSDKSDNSAYIPRHSEK